MSLAVSQPTEIKEETSEMIEPKPKYSICEESSSLGGFTLITYGVGIAMINKWGENESAYAPSLFTNKAEATVFVQKLERGFVTPTTFFDIVEDEFGVNL